MAHIIDAHHHLWRFTELEYGWISSQMGVLRRDFLPDELAREMSSAGVDGTIVVQARQSLAETKWLLECAQRHPFIRGVVGWAPLVDKDLVGVLRELAGSPKLKGLRHVIQDEADGFMLSREFDRGIATIAEAGLVYDILIQDRQLSEAAELVRRHPGQTFVLDHVAKPKIRLGQIEPWRGDLAALAEAGDVYCKISGLVTEADCSEWTLKGLKPYLDTALEAFGPHRLMAGSDWPVCLLASGYDRWWDVVREWSKDLSAAESEMILGGTAERVYRLD